MTTVTNKDVFEEILTSMRKGKSPEDATEVLLKKYPELGLEKILKFVCEVYDVETRN
jgi:hypothetical protein|tara:strand:+ start:149 stop:319 length:171 start_codon:yes stop_codon:yes gene_type:complete